VTPLPVGGGVPPRHRYLKMALQLNYRTHWTLFSNDE
jgi:hypothetical protein